MKPMDLPFHHLVRPPKVAADKPPLLILLHGIGSNEYDLFGLTSYLDKRFLILSARAPNTLAEGSYAWFHVEFTPNGIIINPDEAESSRKTILKFIREAAPAYNADAKRVYLMGFSQGAIMSLSVMLTEPEIVAGVVAMSGRIPSELRSMVVEPKRLKGFPVMVVHGLYDNVLPISYGRESRNFLSTLPLNLTYCEYPMGHQVTEQSLADVCEWLTEKLDGTTAAS